MLMSGTGREEANQISAKPAESFEMKILHRGTGGNKAPGVGVTKWARRGVS